MITLTDTFNGVVLSRHRTLEAAVKAQIRHLRAVRRANGESAYLTYSIDSDEGPIPAHEIEAAEQRVICGYRGNL